MGKNSRKKNNKNKRIKLKPDEIFSTGPLSIARFGKHVILQNNSTPEQHKAFLEMGKKHSVNVLTDLEKTISELQGIVGTYNPLDIMEKAVYMVLPLFMKYRSEADFTSDESLFLPSVEYIQYLIARSNQTIEKEELSEEAWGKLWELSIKAIMLTQQYILFRPTSKNPPSEIDSLRFFIDSQRLMIRGERYLLFQEDYWRDSLRPYSKLICEVYGISIDDLLLGFKKIKDYHLLGVSDKFSEFIKAEQELADRIEHSGGHMKSGATPEEIDQTKKLLESEEFLDEYNLVQEKMRTVFSVKLFDVTDVSGLPINILKLFAVSPAEAVLTDFRSKDDISPLSISPLHYKPFLEVGGRFYSFYHSGLEDHVAEIIEDDLFKKKPSQISVMVKSKSDLLEERSLELLGRILKPDFSFINLYYPNPDDLGNLTEVDGLIGVGDVLFIVEAKSGQLSDAGSRGAPDSLVSDLSDTIIAGQHQSERCEKYIRQSTPASFFDSTAKNKVLEIDLQKYRKIFRIVVTHENLGWVGAQIATLSRIDPTMGNFYPWHVSLDDLRVITDIFEGESISFVHYLEERLEASKAEDLQQHDEIDHVALYLKLNIYHGDSEVEIEGKKSQITYGGYSKYIDEYFSKKMTGENPLRPKQKVPEKLSLLLVALEGSNLPERFDFGSFIYNLDTIGRDQFDNSLNQMGEKLKLNKVPSVRAVFSAIKRGFTFTFAEDDKFDLELKKSAVQLKLSRAEKWYVMQISLNDQGYKIISLRYISPDTYTDEELKNIEIETETRIQKEIAVTKVGRNDQCPCGSGKKYKRCHGA